jgi:hypothetical protein
VFLASGTVFARDAADVVENQLDRFSADWTAMHAEACEATHLRGELSETFLDARLFCLRRRLDEVKALVDVFEQAGNVVIGDAVSAVHDLNNLQDCEDVPALLARQALPRDEKARALVEEQQSRISRVQALLHTGQYAEGLALAEDIVEDIEGTTYKPLEAEAMFMQGRLQHKTGDLQAGASGPRKPATMIRLRPAPGRSSFSWSVMSSLDTKRVTGFTNTPGPRWTVPDDPQRSRRLFYSTPAGSSWQKRSGSKPPTCFRKRKRDSEKPSGPIIPCWR